MALEALSSSELLNLIMYNSNIDPFDNGSGEISIRPPLGISSCSSLAPQPCLHHPAPPETAIPAAVQPAAGRKKRRRRPKVCKNKEEAETQRMTHITVERNRRKQMNEHLAVLRSLMPESYVQRGDQASIVGGAIEFVKELEHILQSLEAKKFSLLGGPNRGMGPDNKPLFEVESTTRQTKAAIADIEVTLIETHANIRILSRRGARRQLWRLVSAFDSALLTILHLNVTTLDLLVLYWVSAKVEEGCQLNSADEIAGAVHHMLEILEEETLGLHV